VGKINRSSFDDSELGSRISIQDRDRKMVELVYQRGMLTTKHLVDLFSDPSKAEQRGKTYNKDRGQYWSINRRLYKLKHKGILCTLEAQKIAIYHGVEKGPRIYVIGDNAVPILEESGYRVPRTNYTELAKSRKSYHHDLSVSDLYVRVYLALKKRGVRYYSYKRLIETAANHALETYPFKPKRWELFRYPTEAGDLLPDDLFAFETSKRHLLFTEVDKNTEPNTSPQERKTVKSTLEKYISLVRNPTHVMPFGVKKFRVLFVTTSQSHIEHILRLLRDFDRETFHFTTFKAIQHCADILELPWVTNKGNTRTLI
jgi:hypothetical protein